MKLEEKMKKTVILIVVGLVIWCTGIHTGKSIERENSRKIRRARAERLTLFAQNKSNGTWYQQSAEKITDVIGEVFN